ncbi:MAG: SpoIID/LytB domain-containing protein [Solirubrobacteraceae bacterium]|nr:SpoIID/LytB domain-containing protein [Solirubrobacteraceae bacterium]
MRLKLAIISALTVALLAAPVADAATRVIVRGAGFGHGVGLSQYGAYGFAKRGTDYRTIVKHYYRGTELRTLDAEQTVRVLLQTAGTVRVSNVRRIAGGRALSPGTTYTARGFGSEIVLRTSAGRSVGRFAAPLRLVGADGGLRLGGRAGNGVSNGRYRGDLELRPTSVGVNAINAVGLEDYVRGVISAESPASWPAAALQAQAVVARTYAITTNKPGAGFDHYPDVRSQVYTGIRAEYASTDAAVRATSRQVVTYQGKPVVTYFFSTSGGKTENVENSFIGSDPKPWLKSVDDPYDSVSPKHRWGPYRWTPAQAKKRFGSWVKGSFRGVTVVRRGASPRIVYADIVGSRGRTRVSGPQIRARLGLDDTWVTFRVIGTTAKPPASTGGGASPRVRGFAQASTPRGVLRGSVRGGAAGVGGRWLKIERRSAAGTWSTELETRAETDGTYRAAVRRPGAYRVRVGVDTGPTVRVR